MTQVDHESPTSAAGGSDRGATMNPNPLLDPLLRETAEAHQQELLETARVTMAPGIGLK